MKDIEGYEGRYAITKEGKVWSYPKDGKIGKWLNPVKVASNGYHMVTVIDKNGKKRYRCIYRILAETYLPNPQNLAQVDHLNGIKTDIRLENLDWVTQKENLQRSYKMGLTKKLPIQIGISHHNVKLTEKQVKEIRYKSSIGIDSRTLSTAYNVSYYTIWDIIKRRSWTHI